MRLGEANGVGEIIGVQTTGKIHRPVGCLNHTLAQIPVARCSGPSHVSCYLAVEKDEVTKRLVRLQFVYARFGTNDDSPPYPPSYSQQDKSFFPDYKP